MKMTSRDQLILMVLPAVLICMGYVWLHGRAARGGPPPATRPAVSTAPAEVAPGTGDALLAELREEKADFERQQKQLLHDIQKLTLQTGAGSDVIAEVTALLLRHEMKILRAEPMENTAAKSEASLWRIQAEGTYMNMLKALQEVSLQHTAVVPTTVNMGAAMPGERNRVWTVVLRVPGQRLGEKRAYVASE